MTLPQSISLMVWDIEVCASQGVRFVRIFTEELLQEFQEIVSAAGRAEIASYLLNYRMEYFRPKKKSFDFDDF